MIQIPVGLWCQYKGLDGETYYSVVIDRCTFKGPVCRIYRAPWAEMEYDIHNYFICV